MGVAGCIANVLQRCAPAPPAASGTGQVANTNLGAGEGYMRINSGLDPMNLVRPTPGVEYLLTVNGVHTGRYLAIEGLPPSNPTNRGQWGVQADNRQIGLSWWDADGVSHQTEMAAAQGQTATVTWEAI